MPTNDAAKDDWFYVDPVAMLEARGYSTGDSDASFVELTEPLPDNGWPYPRTHEEFLTFRTPPSTHPGVEEPRIIIGIVSRIKAPYSDIRRAQIVFEQGIFGR